MKLLALIALVALAAPAAAQIPRSPAGPMAGDTNHDGKLSLEEYQKSRRDFVMRFDTNHDGVINGAEATAGAKKVRNELSANGIDGSGLVDLGIFDLLDINRSGTVSPAELDAAAAVRFARADTNHDGFVTEAEAKAFLKRRMQADTNGDSRLSLDEYLTSRRNFLMRADFNGDGVISRAEWTDAAEVLRSELAQRDVDRLDLISHAGAFNLLDTDKNGVLTRAEIDAFLTARFARMDTNHNGTLSPAEISTFLTR